MKISSIGDLARTLVLQNRSVEIRNDIATLTDELATGQVSDISQHLNGDMSHLADINYRMDRNQGYATGIAEAGLFAQTLQISLENLSNRTGDLASSLTAFGNYGIEVNRTQASMQAESELQAMIGSLNQSVAGRSLLAGTATDQVPLKPAKEFLDALRAEVAGATTADDVIQAAQTWFDDPSGFTATLYQGSDQSLAPRKLGENDEVSLTLRADDPAIREVLMNTTLAALATDPSVGLSDAEQTELLQKTGSNLRQSREELVGLQANVGYVEGRIELAKTENAASTTSLELARDQLIGADQFEVAARLQSVQTQLQALYSVTARTSSLSLVNFLR